MSMYTVTTLSTSGGRRYASMGGLGGVLLARLAAFVTAITINVPQQWQLMRFDIKVRREEHR